MNMNTMTPTAWPSFNLVVRWGARLLSALILMGWGFFAVAHLVGDAGSPSRPLIINDYLGLAMMFFSMVGLAMAWKWEFWGAALTLAMVLFGALINWRVVFFPLTLVPIAAILFLLSWWLNKPQTN